MLTNQLIVGGAGVLACGLISGFGRAALASDAPAAPFYLAEPTTAEAAETPTTQTQPEERPVPPRPPLPIAAEANPVGQSQSREARRPLMDALDHFGLARPLDDARVDV